MGQMTKAEIIAALMDKEVPKARATLYADAFLEYREATENIEKNGVIVTHPRNGNPIENPYLAIRDRAARKLEALKRVPADFLW
jgi:phage terminase small subunit